MARRAGRRNGRDLAPIQLVPMRGRGDRPCGRRDVQAESRRHRLLLEDEEPARVGAARRARIDRARGPSPFACAIERPKKIAKCMPGASSPVTSGQRCCAAAGAVTGLRSPLAHAARTAYSSVCG